METAASYTCITCRMMFPDGEQQREHYRSAWHCFNLKRKVAGLPPVTQSAFEEKVEQLKSGKDQPAITPERPRGTPNEIAEIKRRVEKPEPAPVEEVKEPSEEDLIQERLRVAKAIPSDTSFFDNHVSPDMESNLEYMRKKYGLFIPEVDFLVDLTGLMEYLGQKVGIGYACLWCDKEFRSVGAVQSHMVDKSHCKISFYEHEEEYEEFYDFSKADQDDVTGKQLVEVDDDKPLVHLTSTGGELVLPNGTAIGHRALRVYYKQRLRTPDTRQCILANRLAHQYRDLGLATHLAERLQHETKAQHRALDSSMRLGIKGNKLPKYMRHNTSMC